MRSHQIRRRRRKNTLGVILIASSGLAIAALLTAWLTLRPAPRDDNNCPQGGPAGVVVVLIDATDDLAPAQRLDLRNRLLSVIDNTPVDHGLQFWRVAPVSDVVPTAATPMICNPGRTVSPLTGNPEQVATAYQSRFKDRLEPAMDALLSSRAEGQSPIMESIQATALRVFRSPEYPNVTSRALVLASDLLQHTDALSQLRELDSFERARGQGLLERLGAQLDGVDVTVFYIARDGSPQGRRHIEFWQDYLGACGARLTAVHRIAGTL